MPASKPPKLNVAPEFASLGRLANVLKPNASTDSRLSSAVETSDTWTVFGVSALWQTAAENAARLAQTDIAAWLTATIREAAAAEGVPAAEAAPSQSEAKALA